MGMRLGKRIIFCADGTWDSQKDHTNVYKMFMAIKQGPEQVAFYDDGVGVQGDGIQRFLGGAFGEGLFQKIKDGYNQIASVYEPGDEIYIFGFSRGAYTARSLAGMISTCGLPTKTCNKELLDAVFTAYRDREHRGEMLGALTGNVLHPAPIKMVGVWDTVGSLGIPAIFGGVDPIRYGFLDTSLHPNIQNAYQALAIDEHRREFPPTLWTLPKDPVPGQTVEQVWFPGVHSDVGGGYPDTECGLSDVTFSWMLSKAEKLGLQVYPAVAQKYDHLLEDSGTAAQAVMDKLHHSWNVFWGLPRWRHVPEGATLSNSVTMRCAEDPSYQPRNLDAPRGALSKIYNIAAVVTDPTTPVPVQVAANQDKPQPDAKPAPQFKQA